MEKELARKIVGMAIKCMGEMNESVRIAQDHCDPDEFKALRRGAGHVIAELQERIMDPIFREHMDLIPDEANYAPLSGPTLADIARMDR